jgi:nucleoside-diphosphate-sugar epimerase
VSSGPVLVTGASGFIGAALLRRLRAAGAEVHGVARRPPAGAAVDGVVWHAADLGECEPVRELVARIRPARVYHLASAVSGRADRDFVLPTLHDNLLSTVHLLLAAEAAGVGRVVLAGSMEEPEPGEAPSSPYSASKAAATLYGQLFAALYRLPVVNARIYMVYGPGQRDATKVVPASIRAALAGEAPRLSSGTRPVDWIYVDDVAEALERLAETPGLEGRRLDVGSGELITVRALVERICELCGGPPPAVGAIPDRPLERVRRADAAATEAATGWRARVALDEGLRRTIAGLRAERGA